MAINFLSLEKSEIELKQSFVEFLKLCYKSHGEVCNFLKQEHLTKEDIETMHEYKIKAKEKKRDVRDDCIWIISKDQPRANHLRFIIAILYSVRDLERIVEQQYNIIWYFANSKLSNIYREIINETMTLSKTIFKSMQKIFEQKDVTKHNDEVKKLAEDFKTNYRESLSKMMKSNKPTNDEELEYIYNFTIIMKYIDRIIDHIWYIYRNFCMIKNKD